MPVTHYNFKEAKEITEINIRNGVITNIVGDGGIGKTQMMKAIARDNNMNFITIAANNLKEGELSMPLVSVKDNAVTYEFHEKLRQSQKYYNDYKEYVNSNKEQITERELYNLTVEELKAKYIELSGDEGFVDYTPLNLFAAKDKLTKALASRNLETDFVDKMVDVEEVRKEYKSLTKNDLEPKFKKSFYVERIYKLIPKPQTLLFIDEIGRADQVVQSELMNFLLEREINGFHLPDNVAITLAQNPSSTDPLFEESNYTTNTMDDAVSNRFCKIIMKPDLRTWLEFANQFDKDNPEKQLIHPRIVEFITEVESTALLYVPGIRENQDLNATSPRSWELVSRCLYSIDEEDYFNTGSYDIDRRRKETYLSAVASGLLNIDVATKFVRFIIDKSRKLPSPSELLFVNGKDRETILEQHIKVIEGENTIRKISVKNTLINYMINNPEKVTDKTVDNAMKVILIGGVDTNLSILRRIAQLSTMGKPEEKEMMRRFEENDNFIDSAYEITESKNKIRGL